MIRRRFVSVTLAQLIDPDTGIIPALETAIAEGSTNALKNSATGFLKETAGLSLEELDRIYESARYEAWLRVQALPEADPSKAALAAQWTHPRGDRITVTKPNYFPSLASA